MDPLGVNTVKWVHHGDGFVQVRLALAVTNQLGDLRQRALAPPFSHLQNGNDDGILPPSLGYCDEQMGWSAETAL